MDRSATRPDPASMIDDERYPLRDASRIAPVVVAARGALAADGVAILEDFVRASVVAEMCAEADRLEPSSHHQGVEGTPYLALPDESFPDGHPRRALVRSHLTAIAYDQFPSDSALRALYEWETLSEFIASILGVDRLHRYADPLGALNVAVMREGDELGWHFDQTDFVVSIALQSSSGGGDFETASQIRNADDECYDAVRAVLDGDVGAVSSIPMRPGTLMLFEGRHSMHRVTPIVGETPRQVALLAYDTRPGTDSTDLLKLVRYGRLPADPGGST